MAYKQVKKYGYRDSLEKGDPEKVIYGVDFDAEFEAIEEAFGNIFGEDGAVGPDDPAFEQVVFQNRTEDQQVISKFTFAVAGQAPLTVENTGIWNDVNYVRYDTVGGTWKVFPGLEVDGDFTVNGETSLNGDLNVDGDIDATGNLNVDQNVTIGGQVEGDLTVHGNIIIDGGSIVDPDGTPQGSLWTLETDGSISRNSVVRVNSSNASTYTEFKNGQGIEQRVASGMENGSAYRVFINGMPTLQISNDGDYSAPNAQVSVSEVNASGDISSSGAVNAGSFVKSGGTSSQLLCADGSVVNKASVGSDTDLTGYYTKTESDNKYEPKFAKNTGFNKNLGTTAGTVSEGNHTHAYSSLTGLPTLYTGADAVKLTGNQEVAGIKTFASDIRCKANVYAYYGSDERLKDDITPMPVGLIDAIEPATWKWKEDGRSSAGVVAQQLQQAGLGDWVRESPDGDLGVDYNALIGMLIAEVQDLKRRLADG